MNENPKKINGQLQKDKFLQTAKEQGCDESVEAFEKKLKKITTAKPVKKEKD